MGWVPTRLFGQLKAQISQQKALNEAKAAAEKAEQKAQTLKDNSAETDKERKNRAAKTYLTGKSGVGEDMSTVMTKKSYLGSGS